MYVLLLILMLKKCVFYKLPRSSRPQICFSLFHTMPVRYLPKILIFIYFCLMLPLRSVLLSRHFVLSHFHTGAVRLVSESRKTVGVPVHRFCFYLYFAAPPPAFFHIFLYVVLFCNAFFHMFYM